MLRRIAFAGSLLTAACSSSHAGPGNGVSAESGTGGAAGRSGPGTPQAGRNNPGQSFPFNPGGGIAGWDVAGGGGASGTTGPVPEFSVAVREQGFVVLMQSRNRYVRACRGKPVLEKATTDGWSALRDERPPSTDNPGYYVDGTFVPPTHDLGCDFDYCRRLGNEEGVGSLLEYWWTGEAPPPNDRGLSPDPVATLERHGLRGPMRVLVTYYEAEDCSDPPKTEVVEFTGPEGVCCGAGPRGCPEVTWSGGWGPAEGLCGSQTLPGGVYYRLGRLDPWGCPTLVADPSMCCNCGDDAGVAF